MTTFLLEAQKPQASTVIMWVVIAVLVGLAIFYFIFSGRRNKQRQREYVEQLEAIRPGHKVKTAGGICGIVVEVCDEDNTVIIETGSEKSGKSYVKMDKELIAQTDAKGPTQIAREEAEARRKAEREARNHPAPEDVPTPEEPAHEEPAPDRYDVPAPLDIPEPVEVPDPVEMPTVGGKASKKGK